MLLRRVAVTNKNGVSDKVPFFVWHLHKSLHSLVLYLLNLPLRRNLNTSLSTLELLLDDCLIH